MTIEEKAAAYDLVVKQRDAFILMLADLLDSIYSGCYNDWDISPTGTIDRMKEGDKFELGPCKSADEWIKVLHHHGLFHIAKLVEKVKEFDLKLKDSDWKYVEIVNALEKFNPQKILDNMKWYQDHSKEKPEEKDLKNIIMSLYIWLNECPMSEHLPADEQSIFKDSVSIIIRKLMMYVNVDPDNKEQLIDALHELDPNIHIAENK